jgi:hypothetical protein
MEERFRVGQWVAPYTIDDGDATALKVEAIGENHDVECYVLSDRSLWSVETGAPLTRLWKGHRLRDLPESVIVNRLPDMLRRLIEDADHDTLAKTYAAMLETIR